MVSFVIQAIRYTLPLRSHSYQNIAFFSYMKLKEGKEKKRNGEETKGGTD